MSSAPWQVLLEAVGLGNWKDLVWENAGILTIALVGLLVLPLLLSVLPSFGGPRTTVFLDPEDFRDLPLVERKDLTHNTRWFK